MKVSPNRSSISQSSQARKDFGVSPPRAKPFTKNAMRDIPHTVPWYWSGRFGRVLGIILAYQRSGMPPRGHAGHIWGYRYLGVHYEDFAE
ncbi:uncharacterized protein N7503_003522 [Penicillium pulvis]|uniref:uncharacterized protein n=1 Tax=Penicillium pulvis TaxID=1562058 RepID=UPI002546883D|nr:uncharacterized protein N7503_003522 [Penicillium pulvis]KAJ5805920.1 hypothetical protein N7503_003522 [Penicillium pulvis]